METNKQKVVFITEDFYPQFIGGGGIYAYNLVKQLYKSNEIDLTVIAEDSKERKKHWQQFKNFKLILTPNVKGNQLILGLLQFIYFKTKLNKEQFDILHATQLSGLFFILFKPKNVSKIVITVHHTFLDMSKESPSIFKKLYYLPLVLIEKFMYQHAINLIFHTTFEKENMESYYNISQAQKAVIPLGTEIPRFTQTDQIKARQQVRVELSLDRNQKIVLYLGRLVKRKKVDTLLKSLKLLQKQKYSVTGLIIGRGKEKQALEKMAPTNTVFLDYVEDTRPYLLASDLFILTSVAEGGVALAVMEAASFGLPLIISPSVNSLPLLIPGKNGFIVDPDDYNNLAEKIKRCLSQRSIMGKLSKKLVKPYTWQNCAKKTVNFYYQLLQKS